MQREITRRGWPVWMEGGLLLGAAAWAILRVAPGTIKDVVTAAARSATWPQKDIPEFSSFVRTSPVGQIVYELAGSRGTWEYVLLHGLAAIAAVALLAMWISGQVPADARWTARRLVVLSPVAAVLVIFLGAYDPFTVLGTVALLYAWSHGRAWTVGLAGAYLGFQHFEQGLVVVTVAVLMSLALTGDTSASGRRPSPGWAYVGLAVGKALLTAVLWAGTGDAVSGRSSYLIWEWVRPALVSGLNFGPVLLLSFFSGAWAIVLLGLLQRRGRSRWLAFSAFAVCLVPTALAADHTRIFVLCSLPGLMMLTAAVLSHESTTPREVALIEGLAWVVTPIFIWQASEGFGYVQHAGVLDLYQMFAQQVSSWVG